MLEKSLYSPWHPRYIKDRQWVKLSKPIDGRFFGQALNQTQDYSTIAEGEQRSWASSVIAPWGNMCNTSWTETMETRVREVSCWIQLSSLQQDWCHMEGRFERKGQALQINRHGIRMESRRSKWLKLQIKDLPRQTKQKESRCCCWGRNQTSCLQCVILDPHNVVSKKGDLVVSQQGKTILKRKFMGHMKQFMNWVRYCHTTQGLSLLLNRHYNQLPR